MFNDNFTQLISSLSIVLEPITPLWHFRNRDFRSGFKSRGAQNKTNNLFSLRKKVFKGQEKKITNGNTGEGQIRVKLAELNLAANLREFWLALVTLWAWANHVWPQLLEPWRGIATMFCFCLALFKQEMYKVLHFLVSVCSTAWYNGKEVIGSNPVNSRRSNITAFPSKDAELCSFRRAKLNLQRISKKVSFTFRLKHWGRVMVLYLVDSNPARPDQSVTKWTNWWSNQGSQSLSVRVQRGRGFESRRVLGFFSLLYPIRSVSSWRCITTDIPIKICILSWAACSLRQNKLNTHSLRQKMSHVAKLVQCLAQLKNPWHCESGVTTECYCILSNSCLWKSPTSWCHSANFDQYTIKF